MVCVLLLAPSGGAAAGKAPTLTALGRAELGRLQRALKGAAAAHGAAALRAESLIEAVGGAAAAAAAGSP